MTNYISINEAAKRLDVHPDTIRRMIYAGKLPFIKVGATGYQYRIDEAILATLGQKKALAQ